MRLGALACLACAVRPGASQTVETYEVRWVRQSLTHAANDSRTFMQRWLRNDTYWQTPTSPIFFYSGNEGDIVDFWSGNGFLRSLAPRFGALVLFGECRYYGASVPNQTTEDPIYLSASLILQDYAAVLRQNFSNAPIISFGGSYGGTLTTFFRQARAYPDVVTGAIAASAPVGYYDQARWPEFDVTENTFAEIVAAAYASCADAVLAAVAAIRTADVADVVSAFGACSKQTLYGNSTSDPAALFQYVLESLPQLNYPYPVDGLPAWPCNAACETLKNGNEKDDDARSLLSAAANVTHMLYPVNGQECLAPLAEGPGGIPGDGPGLGSWGYQSCTETLHHFSSNTFVRTYDFNATFQSAICDELYDSTPNTTALADVYGGYDLPYTLTNVFWSNGLLDPWHGGGFLETYFPNSPNLFCLMPNGAHHLDLREPNSEDDPPDVTACRDAETAAIESWLADFYYENNNNGHVVSEQEENEQWQRRGPPLFLPHQELRVSAT